MSVQTKLQLCNRALQAVGQKSLPNFTTASKALTEITNCYDSLRRSEQRRNLWRFTIRRAVLRALDMDTRLVVPNDWDTGSTYAAGDLVAYSGINYISAIGGNTAANPETSDNWQVYFGPRTAAPYDSSVSYFTGEMILTPDGEQVLLSLANDNDTAPFADDWDSATTYSIGDTVWFGAFQYESFTNSNLNNSPGDAPDPWNVTTGYDTPDQVTYLGNVYQASGPTTGDVPTDGAPWTLIGAADWAIDDEWPPSAWLLLSATVTTIFIPYSPGTGPASEQGTKNLYFLPAGYLREAPQNPKAGSVSILGAPTNVTVTDWLMENGFIVTSDIGPIVLRFGADIQNVNQFDPMFFEGLAARIGFEVCEPLTQSGAKKAICAQTYKLMMTEARTVNGIETSPEEPTLDDYLGVRY